jgi:Ser/Thr protein kinase RdoA (MazF antagonist)
VWAHLSADRQKQLNELLGQLLARLHAAASRKEAGHE